MWQTAQALYCSHACFEQILHVSELSEIRCLQMKQQGLLSSVTLGDHFHCMDLQRTVNYWGVCHMKGGQLSPFECFTDNAGLNCPASHRREWATMCSSFQLGVGSKKKCYHTVGQSGAETDTLLRQQSSCQLCPIKVEPHASSRSLSPPPEHNNIMPGGQLIQCFPSFGLCWKWNFKNDLQLALGFLEACQ